MITDKAYIKPKASKWNSFEKVRAAAINYKTLTEFHRKCGSAYDAATRYGYLERIKEELGWVDQRTLTKEQKRIEESVAL